MLSLFGKNLQKIRVAESTIRMLQEQISELSSSDGIVLMKRDYEKLLQTLKQKHHTELYDLNQQIAELNQQLSAKVAGVLLPNSLELHGSFKVPEAAKLLSGYTI